jgi:hypothetical protein
MSGSPTWRPSDYGAQVHGEAHLSAVGLTNTAANLITRKISVFTTVAAGAIVALPVSFASGTELRILNRGTNTLTVWPGAANQIESYGVGVSIGIAPGGTAYFTSFDAPAINNPRTWWLT